MTNSRRVGRTTTGTRAAALALLLAALAAPGAQAALPQQSGLVDLATGTNVLFDSPAADVNAGGSLDGAGDVNGDGFGDVIIGAQTANPQSRVDAGSAFVVFGGPNPATAALGALGPRGFRIDGAVAGDRLGADVTGAGDVNGDGLDDLLVGAYAADGYRGRAYVVFGKADPGTVDAGALGPGGFQIDGQETEDWLGLGLAGGRDVNGDGRDDIVVGARRADNNSRAKSGSAYVIFGRSATTTIDAGALGAAGFRIDGPQATANGGAGGALELPGDMNGDGRSEVAVGVPGLTTAGSAYVVFGKASTAAVDLLAPGSAGYRINGATGDNVGTGLASPGDVNGDGRADLALNAILADNNGRTDSGSVYVLHGKSDTSTVGLTTFVADGAGLRIDGAAGIAQAGRDLAAAGDVNGDGRGDLVLSTFQTDLPGRANAGLAYVVYGTGLTGTQDLTDLGTGGIVVQGAVADGYLEPVAGAGDINGDTRPDVLFAAPSAGLGGTAYALFGFGPAALAYDPAARSGTVGTPLTPLTPSLVRRTGPPAFSVQPALPAGLTIDPATGAISGTPTAALPSTPFTVTMTDLAGSASAAVTLAVQAAPVVPVAAAAGPPKLTNLRVKCIRPKRGRLCRIRLTFKLSEKATVTVSLRRVGARKSLGTVTVRGRKGSNTVLLPAKVKRKTLKAGVLRLGIQPAAGSRRGKAVVRNVKVKTVRGARR